VVALLKLTAQSSRTGGSDVLATRGAAKLTAQSSRSGGSTTCAEALSALVENDTRTANDTANKRDFMHSPSAKRQAVIDFNRKAFGRVHEVSARGSCYAVCFSGVPPGKYRVEAHN
jgi:hypothetical protein